MSDLRRPACGEVLGHSSWRTITQDDVDTFARLTGDEQWIHVDPERAAAGPFGGTIVYGYLTLSLTTLFLDEVRHRRRAPASSSTTGRTGCATRRRCRSAPGCGPR